MNLSKYKLINEFSKLKSTLLISKRHIFKKSREQSNYPCDKALIHFDDFYKSVFGEKWPSIRLALLLKQKYVAVINNFGDIEKTEEFFQSQGAFNLKNFLDVQKGLINKPNKKNLKNKQIALDKVIAKQLKDEEIKEVNSLHPEGVKFKSKVDINEQKNNECEKDEYVYSPEDARTPLEVDLSKAQFDTKRLILPDSKFHKATLSEFIPATKLRGTEDYVAESEYYKFYQPKMNILSVIEEEQEIDFPENLRVFSFDRGEIIDFPPPNKNILNVCNYLKVDGAELLTALALGVQQNDTVLDACSTSENIAYCLFQTLRPKFLVCANDNSKRIANLFSQYLYDFSPLWKDVFYVTQDPVNNLEIDFDKILVNVPSTEDKKSLFEKEENIFHSLKLKARLQLPQCQTSLLLEGLKLVRPGGTVVYTSSTLSPVQNDGVVNEALKSAFEEHGLEFIVKDLSPALQHMSQFFNFADYLNLKFGILVVPFLPVNFGPRYICKLVKKEKETTKLQST